MEELNVYLKVYQDSVVNNAFKGNGSLSALKAPDLTIFASDHISTEHHYKNVLFEACVFYFPSIHHTLSVKACSATVHTFFFLRFNSFPKETSCKNQSCQYKFTRPDSFNRRFIDNC